MKKYWLGLFILVLLIVAAFTVQAQSNEQPAALTTPLGPQFTYQGQLKDETGAPINDTCDLTFGLWDAASGGAQVGVDSVVSGVVVAEGYFTAVLNTTGQFGSSAFNGEARWLETAVRCPTGGGEYTALSPRQPLDAAPLANYALRAPWNGVAGIPTGFADGVDNDTTYTAGTGLTLTGAQFSADLSLIQQRVAGVCGAGFAIRQVNGDGSVTCEPVTGGGAHTHWGESWSGSGTGLTLSGGSVGLSGSGSTAGVSGTTSVSNGAGVSGSNSATSGSGAGVSGQSAATDGRGVTGSNTAVTGQNYGVYGTAASTSGRGVTGHATATTGGAIGVTGQSDSTSGRGVYGYASAASGTTSGVYGQVASTDGWAGYFHTTVGNGLYINAPAGKVGLNVAGGGSALVNGNAIWHAGNDGAASGLDADTLDGQHASSFATSSHNHWGANWSGTGTGISLSGSGTGIYATVSSEMGVGFYGVASSSTGTGIGVLGRTASTGGYGVWGDANATSGEAYGVYGTTDSPDGAGLYGSNSSPSGNGIGVYGITASANEGAGVYGETGSSIGYGVYGHNTATQAQAYGVYGRSESVYGIGVQGNANYIGAEGLAARFGVIGYGYADNGIGVSGSGGQIGVEGYSSDGIGVEGYSSDGIALAATGTGVISSTADTAIYLSPFTAMRRDAFTDLTFTPLDNGGVRVKKVGAGTGERLVVLPISAAGMVFGTPVYVKSLEICYKTSAVAGYITGTGMYKGNGESYATYLSNGTDYNSTTRTCYTINATTRAVINNSSYVQLHLYFTNTTEPEITIFTVKLTLSELPE